MIVDLFYQQMEHQDWTAVVFKPKFKKVTKSSKAKPVGPVGTVEPKYNAGKNIQKPSVTMARKIEEKVEQGDLTLPSVTRTLQLQIQQARQVKKLTQKQLAQACNLQETVIRGYENGTIVPNVQDLMKMSKILGVTLKNRQ